jgi:hypothetical protein
LLPAPVAASNRPLDGELLIKGIKPLVIERYALRANWYSGWYGIGHYKSFLRAFEEYLVLRRRGQHGLPFIQHIAGVVETDLGLGTVCTNGAPPRSDRSRPKADAGASLVDKDNRPRPAPRSLAERLIGIAIAGGTGQPVPTCASPGIGVEKARTGWFRLAA